MPESFRPALTPEEWAAVDPKADEWWENRHAETLGRHEAAARALHGQPFGFTWADVRLLEARATSEEEARAIMGGREPSPLRDLATRIAALLPPEEP